MTALADLQRRQAIHVATCDARGWPRWAIALFVAVLARWRRR